MSILTTFQSESNMTDKELIKKAYSAIEQAYAPYSGFKVGAAVIADGNVYTGCNIENASYGATMCAERCAIFKAVSDGHRTIDKIAIVSSMHDFTMPCGICRQVMAEFMSDGSIIVTNDKEIKEFKISDLLPAAFSLADMKGQ